MYRKVLLSVFILMNVMNSQQFYMKEALLLRRTDVYSANAINNLVLTSQDDESIDYRPYIVENKSQKNNFTDTIIVQMFRNNI